MDGKRHRIVALVAVLACIAARADLSVLWAQDVPAPLAWPISPPAISAQAAKPKLQRLPPVGRPESNAGGVSRVAWESMPPPPELVSTPPSEALPEYASDPNESQFPIDLPTTLRLAGGNNLQIAVAYQKVLAARARLQG
ncbi:MAG: hypothetical protein WD468_01555, partial [Pirellulales bacterium]